MTIRFKDGSAYDTRPGSNILFKILADKVWIEWISALSDKPNAAPLEKVKQVEP